MRKSVMFVIAVMLLVPASVMGQRLTDQPEKDKYAPFKTRREYGVPLFNKIPYLKRFFVNSTVSESFAWSDFGVNVAVASPDGRYLMTGGSCGKLNLWDLESPEKSRPHFANFSPITYEFRADNPIPPDIHWLAWTEDGSQIAVTCNEKLFLLDATSAEIRQTIDLPKGKCWFVPMPFALSACGKFFACECYEDDISCIKVINTETGENVFTKKLPVMASRFVFHPPSKAKESGSISLEGDDDLLPPCFSPDGKYLFVALRDRGMEVLDAKTGETVTAININDRIAPDKKWLPSQTIFSPDGKYLVATGMVFDKTPSENPVPSAISRWDGMPTVGKVFLWDARTFQLLREWNIELGEDYSRFASVAFSRDGKQVLTCHNAHREVSKNEFLLALITTQLDIGTGQILNSQEITPCGTIPLIPELRPLCNSQALKIHCLPESIKFEESFREKIQAQLSFGKQGKQRVISFP